ncbi:MAG TPA: CGNR zinc finger domain-containing protein [Propionibacteriaceae bacterium]|jgi:predicted RNA-binding Zn ribbon-like protein|nr:CGNR zinc finger domain-containing protein [Propionibacteriaceae bacterium]
MTDEAPAPTFEFIGGHVALDLLNTVEWRLDAAQRTDDFTGYAHVLAWAEQAGLITGPERMALGRLARSAERPAEQELAAFRALRETAYAALVERDGAAVDRLVAEHRDVLDRSRLVHAEGHWRWTETELALTTPRDRATRVVVDLLTSPEVAALHQCEDAACGWVYLDTSPRRNRRWCIAADCGNRNRARRYYARKRAESR